MHGIALHRGLMRNMLSDLPNTGRSIPYNLTTGSLSQWPQITTHADLVCDDSPPRRKHRVSLLCSYVITNKIEKEDLCSLLHTTSERGTHLDCARDRRVNNWIGKNDCRSTLKSEKHDS